MLKFFVQSSPSNHDTPLKRVIDGEEHAYFPVHYSQGTTCDITGKPRTTTVMYICIDVGAFASEAISLFFLLPSPSCSRAHGIKYTR